MSLNWLTGNIFFMKHFTFVRNIFTWTRKKKPAITEQLQRHKKKPYTYAKSIISTNRWPYVVVVVTFFPYLPECCVFFFSPGLFLHIPVLCVYWVKNKNKKHTKTIRSVYLVLIGRQHGIVVARHDMSTLYTDYNEQHELTIDRANHQQE